MYQYATDFYIAPFFNLHTPTMRLLSCAPAAALMACMSFSSMAATIQGVVNPLPNDGAGYAAALTDIEAVVGNAALPNDAYIVCIDAFTSFPTFGTTQSYVLFDTVSPLVRHTAAGASATGLIHYVVDRYFDASMTHGDDSAFTGYQFNQALWEITADFDGTLGSLSSSTGSVYANVVGTLYPGIVEDLRTNFASITSYRSTQYDVAFLDAVDAGYQSMVMFSPLQQEVPEPATASLLLASGLAMAAVAARRRRNMR